MCGGHGKYVVDHHRDVGHVSRLAIAQIEAAEDADHLDMTLYAHQVEVAHEGGEVCGKDASLPGLGVELQGPLLHAGLGPDDVAVPQKGHQIVGTGTHHGILKVDHTRRGGGVIVQDHQVA